MTHAVTYARAGFAVVPLHSAVGGVCSCSRGASCGHAGKHPRLLEWQRAASKDPEAVAAWWAQWPAANVGLATGRASGFWVLDVDGAAGRESLGELIEQHGALPPTPTQRTGSGGTHYLFAPPPWPVQNSASKIAPGIDVRGEGGQIVVAPSVSARGAYDWVHSPLDYEPADAPAWLLALVKRDARPAPPAEREALFPPASAKVLEQARDALARHGPAIEGQGGDQHTFVAAAILTHDHALTFDEARPLLAEWNQTCQPPWSEHDLEAKLRGGAKYGTLPYGCRRAPDAYAAALALIERWRASNPTEAAPLIRQLRVIVAACGDQTIATEIANAAIAATGINRTGLAFPKPVRLAPLETPPGAIEVTPRLHEVADLATAAIAPHVFARAGVLCEIVTANDRTRIADLETPRIQDLMSRASSYVRADGEKHVQTAPPMPVAQILAARRTHRNVRQIEAVVTSPVFLADGSILQVRGYSPQARVYLEPDVEVDVPDQPTREDARAAVRKLADLVCDFRFASRADLTSWLAGVLTPLCKTAIGNAPAPLFCVSAASPGAGKTMLTDVAAAIVGARAEVRPYNPKDPSEWGKRLTAFVRAASPVSVFDNCNGPIGDENLDRLITSPVWSDRVLGASDAPPMANVSTWWATGNHIEPVADTVRRVLMIRIVVDEERPQERTGFKCPALVDHVRENRAELLTAALTILRAYHVAGRPPQALPAWGSFVAWSDLVRGALVWTGVVDPFLTQRRAADELNEPDNDAHDFWLSVIEPSDGTPGAIVSAANARQASEVLGLRESVTAFSLRKLVRRFVDRPRQGKRIVRDGGHYRVERVSSAGSKRATVAEKTA